MLSAAGSIRLQRIYLVCRGCKNSLHPADDRLGVCGGRSRQAQRLLCLAGASWSFDAAAQHLAEFCGLKTSDNTIRKVCHQQAGEIADWRHTNGDAHTEFRGSSGEIEFETDGTSVNTYDGWREMRLGIFAKRALADPTTPDRWADRKLPSPEARTAFAAIEKADRFTSRWRRWAGRLGVGRDTCVHAVADGAKWIWEGLEDQFRHLDGVLDIYHALEHTAETAKVVDTEAEGWLDKSRNILLAEGWSGIAAELDMLRQSTRSRKKRKSIDGLTKYLGNHTKHLNYAAQLASGRTIGSGMVEGACKNVIGRRLKQTGARWRIRRANRMATLATTLYSDQWNRYWDSAA